MTVVSTEGGVITVAPEYPFCFELEDPESRPWTRRFQVSVLEYWLAKWTESVKELHS